MKRFEFFYRRWAYHSLAATAALGISGAASWLHGEEPPKPQQTVSSVVEGDFVAALQPDDDRPPPPRDRRGPPREGDRGPPHDEDRRPRDGEERDRGPEDRGPQDRGPQDRGPGGRGFGGGGFGGGRGRGFGPPGGPMMLPPREMSGGGSLDERLHRLERKLDEVLEELRELRFERPPFSQPGPPAYGRRQRDGERGGPPPWARRGGGPPPWAGRGGGPRGMGPPRDREERGDREERADREDGDERGDREERGNRDGRPDRPRDVGPPRDGDRPPPPRREREDDRPRDRERAQIGAEPLGDDPLTF